MIQDPIVYGPQGVLPTDPIITPLSVHDEDWDSYPVDEAGGASWEWGDCVFDPEIGADALYVENFLDPSVQEPDQTVTTVDITAPVASPDEAPVQIVIVGGKKTLDPYGLFPIVTPIIDNYFNYMSHSVSTVDQSPCGTGVAANKIDWQFVAQREGPSVLNAYVPTQNGVAIDKSGVTIATGFDIGQHSIRDLQVLNLSSELVTKLSPYTLKTQQNAINYLSGHPLSISASESQMIDTAVHAAVLSRTVTSYDNAVGKVGAFYSLPSGTQTAIADAAFNFGNLERVAPNLWSQVTHDQWSAAVTNLNTWQTTSPGLLARRQLEAGLIQNDLNNSQIANGVRC